MQIVIDITPEAMEDIKNGRASRYFLENKILNGKPLPKGHGELIDRDYVIAGYDKAYDSGESLIEVIYNAPTVIEADKEGSDSE